MEETTASITPSSSSSSLSPPPSSSSGLPLQHGMTTITTSTIKATADTPQVLTPAETAKCEKCAEYLQEIFLRQGSKSRPLQILQAMGVITKPNSQEMQVFPVQHGFAVAIPSVSVKDEAPLLLPQPASFHQTSSSSSSSSATPKKAAAATADKPPPKNKEWTLLPSLQGGTIQATSSMRTDPLAAHDDDEGPPPTTQVSKWLEQLTFSCRPCTQEGPEKRARSFMGGPNPSSVVLCTNRLNLSNRQEMEEVLVHEMIHAYDAHVQAKDFRSCLDLAYSEVRAAREAECAHAAWATPCVKTVASKATNNLFPDQGRGCVQDMLSSAMADRKPFFRTAATTATTTTTTTPTRVTPPVLTATTTTNSSAATTTTTSPITTTATSIRSSSRRPSHSTRHGRIIYAPPPKDIYEWNRNNETNQKQGVILPRTYSIPRHSER